MFNNGTIASRLATCGVMFAVLAFGAIGTASAQAVPRSFVASPDIYKVIAQDDKTLVIAVTWKAGQRDQFHSHPANGVYRLTDCNMRIHTPDGKTQDRASKAGDSAVQGAIASHSLENIGKSECKIVMFEPK
jgi:beta-alanine degradation protein BauB